MCSGVWIVREKYSTQFDLHTPPALAKSAKQFESTPNVAVLDEDSTKSSKKRKRESNGDGGKKKKAKKADSDVEDENYDGNKSESEEEEESESILRKNFQKLGVKF